MSFLSDNEREMHGYNVFCEACSAMLPGPQFIAFDRDKKLCWDSMRVVDTRTAYEFETVRAIPFPVSPDEFMCGPRTVAECHALNAKGVGLPCPTCGRVMVFLSVMHTRIKTTEEP